MQREMIDAYIAEGLKAGLKPGAVKFVAPRVPRQKWSERHALLLLGCTLLGAWGAFVLCVALLAHK